MRKLLLLFLFICGLVLHAQAQKNVELSSPNGEIKVSVRLTDKIYYDVACNDEVLLKDNYLQLKLKDKILGEHPKLSGQKQNKIKETLTPVVPLKFSTINNEYNQLLLNFKGNYSVSFYHPPKRRNRSIGRRPFIAVPDRLFITSPTAGRVQNSL